MKILILGGDGMLGHQLLLSLNISHEVRVTLRKESESYDNSKIFNKNNSYFGIDVRHQEDVISVISDFYPDVIINAVGVVKQRKSGKEIIPNLEINALLPQKLALMCQAFKIRLIHFSTDCVFSGKKGNYTESDVSDAEDFYGKAKYLGEVNLENVVTLRTSLIGLELSKKTSLIEWFLAQKGKIKGYQRAIYTGITTLEMARVIDAILLNHPSLTGVWQVASEPINKYKLLTTLKNKLRKENIEIEVDDEFFCDRSLNGEAFFNKTGYQIPSWDIMLLELAEQIKKRDDVFLRKDIKCSV